MTGMELNLSEVVLKRTVRAAQWQGDHEKIVDGCHVTVPEIHWSGDRKMVYFTYGKFHPTHWMGVEELTAPPDTNSGLSSWVRFDPLSEEGVRPSSSYWRTLFPFAFWNVKSESRLKNDHKPVFLDPDDEALLRLWQDFFTSEKWPNPPPRFIEFREMGGQYGRGYKPIYLAAGDWLVVEDGRGTHVMSQDDFSRMRVELRRHEVPT